MYTNTIRYMTKQALHNVQLSDKVVKQKLQKAAITGERMLTTSEAEDILDRILSEYLFHVNLN